MRIFTTLTPLIWAITFTLSTSSAWAQCESLFSIGADVSSISMVENEGITFMEVGNMVDPYDFLASRGCQLIRLRLLHSPNWEDFCGETNTFSNLEDVIQSLQRVKAAGMEAILNIHYSDRWANIDRQQIPAAWANIEDLNILKDSVFTYTYETLATLIDLGLAPAFVQLGNEIDNGFCDPTPVTNGFDFQGKGQLLVEANRAVREVGYDTGVRFKVIYHLSKPEIADDWLVQAVNNNLVDFDVIGLSYFPDESNMGIAELGSTVRNLKFKYRRDVMIVETAFPFTTETADSYANLVTGNANQHDAYPISEAGQLSFLQDLTQEVAASGGIGVVYWEPTWLTSDACTEIGQGSPNENATFYNFTLSNKITAGVDYYNAAYEYPEEIEFIVNMEGKNIDGGVFVSGGFTGDEFHFQPMVYNGNYEFRFATCLMPGETHPFAFYNGITLDPNEKEVVPVDCQGSQENFREFLMGESQQTINFDYGACDFTESVCNDIPNGWTAQDIGILRNPGKVCYDSGTDVYVIGGAGIFMGEERDDFHYMWQEGSGDIGITAKIIKQSNISTEAFAGVMIRASDEFTSPFVASIIAPWGATALMSRIDESFLVPYWNGNVITPDIQYVHLNRQGNTFIAYHSADGINWIVTDSLEVTMPEDIMIGIATHSHTFARTNVAEITEVEITTDPIIIVDQEEVFAEKSFSVFPNPSNGQFYIQHNFSTCEGQLSDWQGRHLNYYRQLEPGTALDLSGLPSGVYILRLNSGAQQEIFKLVKK